MLTVLIKSSKPLRMSQTKVILLTGACVIAIILGSTAMFRVKSKYNLLNAKIDEMAANNQEEDPVRDAADDKMKEAIISLERSVVSLEAKLKSMQGSHRRLKNKVSNTKFITSKPEKPEERIVYEDDVDPYRYMVSWEEEGAKFFKDRTTPRNERQSGFFITVVKREGFNTKVLLTIQYESDVWLGANKFTLISDGDSLESVGKFKPLAMLKKEHRSLATWEIYNGDFSDSIQFLVELSESENSFYRIEGKGGVDERTITSQQKRAIKRTLQVLNN